MKWGLSEDRKAAKRAEDEKTWVPWFAWRPQRMPDETWVWLEMVWRRRRWFWTYSTFSFEKKHVSSWEYTYSRPR